MLLNYDAFKTIVQENFLSYMPFYFRGMELLISPVAKKNMTLDGLRLKGNGVTGTPVIYINDMYALYEENGDLEETIKIFANVLRMLSRIFPTSMWIVFSKTQAKRSFSSLLIQNLTSLC